MADNPFIGAPSFVLKVVEDLLSDIWRAGEWTDDHEGLLKQWRVARGEFAKSEHWRWWIKAPDDETYGEDFATRADALSGGRKNYADDGSFEIIEARLWDDAVKDGDDVQWFAESRNREVVIIAANDGVPA